MLAPRGIDAELQAPGFLYLFSAWQLWRYHLFPWWGELQPQVSTGSVFSCRLGLWWHPQLVVGVFVSLLLHGDFLGDFRHTRLSIVCFHMTSLHLSRNLALFLKSFSGRWVDVQHGVCREHWKLDIFFAIAQRVVVKSYFNIKYYFFYFRPLVCPVVNGLIKSILEKANEMLKPTSPPWGTAKVTATWWWGWLAGHWIFHPVVLCLAISQRLWRWIHCWKKSSPVCPFLRWTA